MAAPRPDRPSASEGVNRRRQPRLRRARHHRPADAGDPLPRPVVPVGSGLAHQLAPAYLLVARLRQDDPTLGRYTQPDPLGFVDGPSVYGYARGNPLGLVDPVGKNSITIGGNIGQGVGAFTPIPGGALIGRGLGMAVGAAVMCMAGDEDSDDQHKRPPAGSRPINQTPWSGDHGQIKGQIGAGPADDVRIDPDGNVWSENPDGTWTDHGPASDYTGSGKPKGKRGPDRDKR